MLFIGWSSLVKPAFIVGNFARGFFHNSVYKICYTFTNVEISRFKDTADLLKNCEPWENHLYDQAYPEINKALKKRII